MPLPSEVLLSFIVGFAEVLQQTPLVFTVTPLSSVIFPPETAVVEVIEVISEVVKTGISASSVVNEI